jgi:hypothetical protein
MLIYWVGIRLVVRERGDGDMVVAIDGDSWGNIDSLKGG